MLYLFWRPTQIYRKIKKNRKTKKKLIKKRYEKIEKAEKIIYISFLANKQTRS